jgi:hypothetical protein
MEEERRTAARRALRAVVTMKSGAFVVNMRTADISPSGICLIGDQRFPVGSEWRIEFRLPTAAGPVPITADVSVVYSVLAAGQGWKSGLQFSRMSQEEFDVVAAFVRRS